VSTNIPTIWDKWMNKESENEQFEAGQDFIKMFSKIGQAPTAFTGGTTGVSPIDWSGMKVDVGAPYKPGGFGPVPSTFPPAQIGGLLGIMGTG
jgi:hypothetical protein